MTLKCEMIQELKAKIERQRHQIMAQWGIIGLLALTVACLVL